MTSLCPAHRRYTCKVTWSKNLTPVSIVDLHEAFRHHENVVRLIVMVETWCICEHSAAGENGECIVALDCGSEDAKRALGTWYADEFAFELWDDVAAAICRWLFEAWNGHGRKREKE